MTAAVFLPGHAECHEEDEKGGWADSPCFPAGSNTTPLTECEKTMHKKERTPPVGWALDLPQPRHQQQQQLKRTVLEELLVALRKLQQYSLDSPPMTSMTHQQKQSSLPHEIDELIYKEDDVSADNLVGCHPWLAQQQTYLQRYHAHIKKNDQTSFSPPPATPLTARRHEPGHGGLVPTTSPLLPLGLGGCCVPHLLATSMSGL